MKNKQKRAALHNYGERVTHTKTNYNHYCANSGSISYASCGPMACHFTNI